MIEILYYKILYVTTVKKIIKISNINPFVNYINVCVSAHKI